LQFALVSLGTLTKIREIRHEHLASRPTWDQIHGFGPMQATARRWPELHPGVERIWGKRPALQALANELIATLAQRFDLLVVDHPAMGEAVGLPGYSNNIPIRTTSCASLLPTSGWNGIWPNGLLRRCCANILKHRHWHWSGSFKSAPTAPQHSFFPDCGCNGRAKSWFTARHRSRRRPLSSDTSMRTTSAAPSVGAPGNIFADAEACSHDPTDKPQTCSGLRPRPRCGTGIFLGAPRNARHFPLSRFTPAAKLS